MISIKQINNAIRAGQLELANQLADAYISSSKNLPVSTKAYLDSAKWRKSNGILEKQNHSISLEDTNIVAGPFANDNELLHALTRLSFYITPFVTSVTILSSIRLPNELPKDDSLDPSIKLTYKQAKARGAFHRSSTTLAKTIASLSQDSTIIVLDFSSNRSLSAQLKKLPAFSHIRCYGVSPRFKNEGSLYIQAIYDALVIQKKTEYDRVDVATLDGLKDLKKHADQDIALVCNGPTIKNISTHFRSTKKQTAITCNTTFMNKELSEYFDFIAVAFADPIFHFGISSYANSFRENLVAYTRSNQITVVIPQKYYHIFSFYFDVAENTRLCVLTPSNDSQIRSDFEESSAVRVTANILTYLMIPLGAYLSRGNIILYGCDGRPSRENSYFWGHDKNSQLSDNKMDNIKAVHPGFFDISYDDYYSEHKALCLEYSGFIHKAGKKIYAQTPSYISAFDRTEFTGTLPHCSSQVVISLNPEYGAKQGHFVDYELALHESLSKRGMRHVVACSNNSIVLTCLPKDVDVETERIFPSELSPPQSASSYREFAQSFVSSLPRLLSKYPGNARINVFCYLSSFRFLDILLGVKNEIASALIGHQKIVFLINGFWDGHMMPDKLDFELLLKTLHSSLINYDDLVQFRYSVDTLEAKNLIIEHSYHLKTPVSGNVIEVLPFFSVANAAKWINSVCNANTSMVKRYNDANSREFDVYFAGTMQEAKGLGLCIQAATLLSATKNSYKIQFRNSSHPVNAELLQPIEDLRQSNAVSFTISEPSSSEYRELFVNSKVVALAYSPQWFKYKHSAIIFDAIASGCILVVQEGTWQADTLKSLASHGLIFFTHDGSVDDFVDKIDRAIVLAQTQEPNVINKSIKSYSPNKAVDHIVGADTMNALVTNRLLSGKIQNYIIEEHVCFDVLKYLQSERRCMFDIGCCHGASSGIFLKNNYVVHAFEPNPDNYNYLIAKFADSIANGSLKLVNAGVGNVAAKLPFAVSKTSFGRHSFFEADEGDLKETLDIEVLRFDDYCQSIAEKDIAYVKVDVEGFEQEVLEGFGSKISQIPLLQLEFDNLKRYNNLECLIERINDFFDCICISVWTLSSDGYGGKHVWNSLFKHIHGTCYDSLCGSWGNIIACNSSLFNTKISDHEFVRLFEARLKYR